MKKFQNLNVRIEFGKKLSRILFSSGQTQKFIQFVKKTPHTGARYDYEKYFNEKRVRDTPYLRMKFPIIEHLPEYGISWDQQRKVKKTWFNPPKLKEEIEITNWYKKKMVEMSILHNVKEWQNLNE